MNLLGWCRQVEDADVLKEAGFDYIECPLTALHLEDEAEFGKQLPRYLNSSLPALAWNVFFPGDLKVVGPDADKERVRRYVAKAGDALGRIGAKIAVLGSGRSRHVSDEWGRARAEEQLLALLSLIADEFRGTGVTLAIEPLNRKESNIINSVDEGVELARQVNRPEIRVLADFYHMDEENEPLETLVRNKDWLAHIHIADTGRKSPGTGQYPYDTFMGHLREIGYSGMISAECSVERWPGQLADSLAFLKSKV